MKAIVRKLLQEFLLTKSKILICILAAGLASWGISSVTFTYLMTERDFKSNFDSSNPADFSLRIENVNEGTMRILQDFLQVGTFEKREMSYLEFQNKDGIWMPIVLYGIENPEAQKLDIIRFKDPSLFNSHGVFIEKNAMNFLGEAKEISLRRETDLDLPTIPIMATVHDPLQAPAQMERLAYGYAAMDLVESISGQNAQRFIFRLNAEQKDVDGLKKEAEKLVKKLEEKGGIVSGLTIKEPGKHIHQPIIDGASFLQKSFGLVLLIIGLTLFSLFLLILLLPQIPQIGILKALGASSRQVFFSFNLVILMIIGLGILIGLLLGILTAKGFNGFFAMVQNFDPVTGAFPLKYYLAVAFISCLVPLLIGLNPVIKISHVTVREAIQSTFQTKSVKLINLLRNLNISSSVKYGVGNLLRSGLKTYLLLLMLILGITLFFTGANLSNSFYTDFNTFFSGTPYQITIRLEDSQTLEPEFLNQSKEIKSFSPISINTVSIQYQGKTLSSKIRKYSPGYSIKEEMFLIGTGPKNCSACIYLHPEMVQDDFQNLSLGDSLVVAEKNGESRSYAFGGILREAMPSNGGLVSVFESKPLSSFNTLAIELQDGFTIEQGIKHLEQEMKKNRVNYAKISDIETNLTTLINHFEPTYLIVQGMGILTMALSLIGILVIINLTVRERISELAILKAMGGNSGMIGRLFSIEFMLTSLLALVISFLLSLWLSSVLADVYGMMIRGQKLQSELNLSLIIPSAVFLMALQWFIVQAYTKSKLEKSANSLLTSLD
ncbi:ABC transporter permease [Algoriphagus confluentis]|uniref:ABC3 transporter permease C-terminal domain-containing protein n=1 Tax=Algoriphagus confluentis TaxID=1697556 RepID=A0ABQ6PSV6_9BACT|nr:hypothetical protein Aconfl_33640 [Algoriphagus confluentis]